MDNKSTNPMGGDTGRMVPFPGVNTTNEQIEQSGAIFGGEEDEGEAFYTSNNENGQNLMNAGPAYGEPMPGNNNEGMSFAAEVENTLKTADINGDGVVSASEELEYMDDQGVTISKNLTKLTDKQAYAVEKDIDKQIKHGDARGAVIALQKWRDKMLDEAFGRHIGDRNAA